MPTRKRKDPTLRTKLAAAVSALFLTHDEAVALSEDQVLSLVQWDHYPILHVDDGPDVHWNLTPRLIPGHRAKTAKIDVPAVAKRKRITKTEEAFRARLLAKTEPTDELRAFIAMKFPKGRKLQSRGFPKKEKRR